jgi:hypothetical protein
MGQPLAWVEWEGGGGVCVLCLALERESGVVCTYSVERRADADLTRCRSQQPSQGFMFGQGLAGLWLARWLCCWEGCFIWDEGGKGCTVGTARQVAAHVLGRGGSR